MLFPVFNATGLIQALQEKIFHNIRINNRETISQNVSTNLSQAEFARQLCGPI